MGCSERQELVHNRRSALPRPQLDTEARITEADLPGPVEPVLGEAPKVAPLVGPSGAAAALGRQQLRVEARA